MGWLARRAERRRIRREIEMKRGLKAIRRHIAGLEASEIDFAGKARRARQLGADDQLAFLRSTLRRTVVQKRLVERQLLHLETALQIKDHAEACRRFAASMRALSAAIGESFAGADLERTQEELEEAMARARTLEERMELMLDVTQEAVGSFDGPDQVEIGDDEIDRMIAGGAATVVEGGDGVDEILAGLGRGRGGQ